MGTVIPFVPPLDPVTNGVRLLVRDGLGAVVTVETAEGATTKSYDGKSGYLSQSAMPLYFGLGDASAAARVTVRWPSGKRQVLTENLPVNGLLQVREPQ